MAATQNWSRTEFEKVVKTAFFVENKKDVYLDVEHADYINIAEMIRWAKENGWDAVETPSESLHVSKSKTMTTEDRYAYIKNLGKSRILLGPAAQALDKTFKTQSITAELEQTVIKAMADCHARQTELMLNNSCNILFDSDMDTNELLTSLNEGYRKHIQSIIQSTMETGQAWEIASMAIAACARYVNICARMAISNARYRIPSITKAHSDTLVKALSASKIKTQTTPDEDTIRFMTMLRSMLFHTAHYMDPGQIPEDAYAKAAEYAIHVEYGGKS